jgi:hypothetical protein
VRLLASGIGRAQLPRNIVYFWFWYSFLLEAEYTPRPSAAGRIRFASLGLEPATFRLVAKFLKIYATACLENT